MLATYRDRHKLDIHPPAAPVSTFCSAPRTAKAATLCRSTPIRMNTQAAIQAAIHRHAFGVPAFGVPAFGVPA